jgi:acetyltransferase
VKGALLLAGGFSEASEAGRALEEQTVAVAREHGVRLIGPNTNGMFSARHDCNAIAWYDIPRGPAVMLANSANVMLSILAEAQFHRHFGFNAMLSVGNQADLQFHEYLEAFAADPDVGAILSYVEGFRNGEAFVRIARGVTPRKPIVMYKAGRTSEGVAAAKSHSGSLAGDYAVTRGVLRQVGVVTVERGDCLYPVSEALSLLPPMRSRRVALLSEGGGVITIAAEALAERGMVLATLSEETQQRIHAIVPNASQISNPVDAGGGTDPRAEYYGQCGRAILEDPNVDALMLTGFFGGYALRYGNGVAEAENAVCRELAQMMREYGKPVVVQSHYAHAKPAALDLLREVGVPYYRHIEIAAQCLASAAEYAEAQRRLATVAARTPRAARPVPEVHAIVERARAAGRAALLETEAREVLGAAGIAVPPLVLARSSAEAASVVAALGEGPLALKVVSPDVLHKSDSGGVRLSVRGEQGVREAVAGIVESVARHCPGARIEGVLATPMAGKGVELIIGVSRDAQFGPVLMVGLGGVFVETLKDVVFRALPLEREDALEMIGEIRLQAMLEGNRGLPRVNREALADLLLQVADLAAAHLQIAEIDLNPVIARADGWTIADARMILAAD